MQYGIELDSEQAQAAIQESLDIEARIADVTHRYLREGLRETDSAYSPFARVAEELGYTGDPDARAVPVLHDAARLPQAVSSKILTKELRTHG